MSILELGCNIGLKLEYLKQLGFENLTGLEINKDTVNQASKRNTDIKFIHGTIEDFVPESSYDLVFTSETLIYISPENIKFISDKIQRMAKNIFLVRSFSPNLQKNLNIVAMTWYFGQMIIKPCSKT